MASSSISIPFWQCSTSSSTFSCSLQRNFDLCIPRKGNVCLSPNFHIHVSVSDLYIPSIGHLFPAAEWADRSWEYMNRTQKHECRNWDWGRAVSLLGIFVSNIRYSIFAVFPIVATMLNCFPPSSNPLERPWWWTLCRPDTPSPVFCRASLSLLLSCKF